MRILLSLFVFLFFTTFLFAQIRIDPLESNPVIEQAAAKKYATRLSSFIPQMQEETIEERGHDCDNIDGAFTSGETLYVVSGDSLTICYNTELYPVFEDASVNLSFGTSTIGSSCIRYFADEAVSLGLTDTLRVRFCTDVAQTDCFSFFFPIIVKRADTHTSFPLTTLAQEQVEEFCVTSQLEGEIHQTSIRGCGNELLGKVYNVDFGDECFVYAASRFAEVDSVCFEVCDEYCICDAFTFYINTVGAAAPFPFMDDFSYHGPYPDVSKWLDDNVFINNTMGYQPPSIGVATFDGLDESGTPRRIGTARSDFLTSNYFSFDENSNEELWLSFWLENKGYSYPSNPGDSLIVEFKNKNGDWRSQFSVDGQNYINSELPPFNFYKIQIPNNTIGSLDTFFFDGFQFRFVNIGNTTSIQDTWHLDYVILDEGEPDDTFDDMAFVNVPTGILANYTSMPFWHFEENVDEELIDTIKYSIRNLFSSQVGITDSDVSHYEVTSTGMSNDLGISFKLQEGLTNVPAQSIIEVDRVIPASLADDLANTLETNFAGETSLRIERTYSLTSGVTQSVSFEDVLRNDEVSHSTVFDNYFAYDDGTAEGAASVTGAIRRAAVRFTANVADTLRGVSIHFPHYNQSSDDDLFNLKVWVGTLDSEPVFERDLIRPFFIDEVYADSLQGFTTYRLSDFDGIPTPVAIPAGDFFIGWQNGSSINPVRIGFDRNSTDGVGHQFVSDNGSDWFMTADLGSYMIRPIVGTEVPGVSANKEITTDALAVKVYPNPASEQLFFELPSGEIEEYEMTVLTVSGQVIDRQPLRPQIDISQLVPGIYFIQMIHQSTKTKQVERVVVF